ncbi:hypothetical protein ACVJGD_000306 [Bradyrhizobium sp. USDA 10063]
MAETTLNGRPTLRSDTFPSCCCPCFFRSQFRHAVSRHIDSHVFSFSVTVNVAGERLLPPGSKFKSRANCSGKAENAFNVSLFAKQPMCSRPLEYH